MRIRITVLDPERSRAAEPPSPATHLVHLDAVGLATPEGLFDAMAAALDFPGYFGRNWDALYECFSDYFVVERGGLGSEFDGRTGVEADAVRIVFSRAGALVHNGSSMAADITALLRYTREVNSDRAAVDLAVEFLVDDPVERAALEAVVGSSS
jgi:Barstar (barnase inhibitor)